jgi:opacity protein-like surface antigen
MKIYAYALLVVLLLIAGCAHDAGISTTSPAINIDGTWSGTFSGGMGGQPMELTYNFKGEGDKLTGTVNGGPGQWIPLKDGKIKGEKLSFKVDVDLQGMKMKFNYKGVIKGDEIELTFTSEMGGGPGMGPAPPQSFTVKRVK